MTRRTILKESLQYCLVQFEVDGLYAIVDKKKVTPAASSSTDKETKVKVGKYVARVIAYGKYNT